MEWDIIITDSKNEGFINLIKLLNNDLDERYGELQKKYDKHNKVDYIKDVVLILKNSNPVACGAFKEFDKNAVEIKRVFVKKEFRRQGLSKMIMNKLEELAKQAEYDYAILETGQKQYEAINLYKNFGYKKMPNYGPYVGNSNSICMKKRLF